MFFFSFLGVKREPQDRGKRTTNNRHQSQSKTSRTRFRYGKDQRDTWSENRRKVRRPESRWNWYIGLRLMQECWIEPISNFLWCFTSFRSWRFWLCRQELSVNWKERKENEGQNQASKLKRMAQSVRNLLWGRTPPCEMTTWPRSRFNSSSFWSEWKIENVLVK